MVAVLEATTEGLRQLLDLTGRCAVVIGGRMGVDFGGAQRLEVTIADLNAEAAPRQMIAQSNRPLTSLRSPSLIPRRAPTPGASPGTARG